MITPLPPDEQRLRDRWLAGRFGDAPDSANSFARLSGRLGADDASRQIRISRRSGRTAFALGVGAAMIALMILVYTARVPQHPASQTYATAIGQRKQITLADGTRIVMAPQTTLRVVTSSDPSTRTVRLLGEAYFDVAPDVHHPFIVQTGPITTRVLGTAFDVKHYPQDERVQIAVVTGRVMSRSTMLAAGQLAWMTDSTTSTTVVSDMTPYTGWTAGHLVFQGAPVPEMLDAVGRWYGYRFKLADAALAQRHVNASLGFAQAADALKTIALLLDVTMTFDGEEQGVSVVTLHAHRAGRAPTAPKAHPQDFFPSSQEIGR